MSNDALKPGLAWPSRRLLFKLILAMVCAPTLTIGLSVLLGAAFAGSVGWGGGGTEVAKYGVVGLAVIFAGPFALALTLSGLGKSLVSGCLSILAMGVGMYVLGQLSGTLLTSNAMYAFPLAVVAGMQIATLELASGDIRDKSGIIGVGIGLGVGLTLVSGFSQILDPKGESLLKAFSVPWATYSSLVWLSAVFFPDLVRRKVGWGGVLIWALLVGLVSGAALILKMSGFLGYSLSGG